MSAFAINGVVQAEYEYNALGQQVVRRLPQSLQTIHSLHDAAGNRIAEYLYDETTLTSSLIREYLWADGMIVAVVEAGQMYFVRTDHIGRPAFATDSSGTKVWEATYLPFGGIEASTGPNLDLRFPGQWFQSETGLHQNWMRDYDPTLGRYIQADPLGLVDGASMYGYALQNPARYVDPRGEQSITRGIFGPMSYPSSQSLGQSMADAGGHVRNWSHYWNPIDLLFQWCFAEDGEPTRCDIIYQKCRQNCIDYFVEGPFAGHSGAAQAAGMRRCIRECMHAHDCPY